jgi:PadR family transcriptional regulator AphA
MSSIQYAILSLLAREPLSGYDIKQQMNGRLGPFWTINNNQLYPTLAKLEADGLVELQAVEQTSYRPARKVYAITEVGKERLRAWVTETSELASVKDEFMLKVYSSWLVDPTEMGALLTDQKRRHAERLAAYTAKVADFRAQFPALPSDHPLFSTLAVIEMGIAYEQSYIAWCDRMIEWLKSGQVGQ